MQLKTALSTALALALCSGAALAADQATYEQALADAQAALQAADAVGGAWRDTALLLKAADEAARAGDFGKAVQLAEAAAFQGRMGAQQANEQATAGNPGYLQ